MELYLGIQAGKNNQNIESYFLDYNLERSKTLKFRQLVIILLQNELIST
jgi:hypothetical protein